MLWGRDNDCIKCCPCHPPTLRLHFNASRFFSRYCSIGQLLIDTIKMSFLSGPDITRRSFSKS